MSAMITVVIVHGLFTLDKKADVKVAVIFLRLLI